MVLLLAHPCESTEPVRYVNLPEEYVISLACLVNWEYSVTTTTGSGSSQSQTLDACSSSMPILFLNVFLWFALWFVAAWIVMLATQSC